MKRQEKRESPPTPPQASPPPEKKEEAPAPGTGAPRPSYVFKIAPADPKNAFDFEDVADK